MGRNAPIDDKGDIDLEVESPKTSAAGVPAVVRSMRMSLEQMGVVRTARTLLRINQDKGFDCPGCAWPDPAESHRAEFCENGAKAVAEEATRRRVTPEFFAEHSIASLREKSDHWLGQQGRLTTPMHKPQGAAYYEPVTWERALDIVADHLRDLDDPDQAIFYTSGRTSNEAAFAYQLFVREFGTNNLPDCSNMCHESSGTALNETIGIGKGTVTLDDITKADLILVVGQNPGTNHPRMLSTLETAKGNGARVIAINPLPEAGLMTFRNPQTVRGVVGPGTALADRHVGVRLGGDQALFQAVGHLLLERGVVDHEFVEGHTSGFEVYAAARATLDWPTTLTATGLNEADIRALADDVAGADRIIVCWAMGITQHRHAVATIQEMLNVLLLGGHIGREGAGVCPVRGHSNVQGDRTMGIFERPSAAFLDALDAEFSITSPREHGVDAVDTVRALRDRRATVFFAMGGNFVRAMSDSDVTEEALEAADLTCHVSTKLNRSHTVTGREALILPTLGRTERDEQATGEQVVTVEDSMAMVHASRGRLGPASHTLLSEVAIVCELARRVLPASPVDWAGMRGDYRVIRDHISRVVPGFDRFEERILDKGGFQLPLAPRQREFNVEGGRARFSVHPLEYPQCPPGRLLLQTIRSHDQYNTTIYGLDDHYRGVSGGRRVVFVNPSDLAALGLADEQLVDIVSEWRGVDGNVELTERRAEEFRVVAYPTARGCAAAYFPEANVLVPLDSTARGSNTPTSKSVVIRLEAR
ncbi:FdhF/YdeP family oxidoreductase [Knoellia sp. S7-12]|uniref:FdhF/YdeP family oxidoreductase n=1 Tax=Knoellia sp. S7-12 TaxID=3126698 RepID=UPI003365E51F